MIKTTEWHNVEMELVIELTPELIDTMRPEVQVALNPLLPPDWIEEVPIDMHIEFKSSGYSDPGRWGSCPDDSQAPEGADDREMGSVYLMTSKCVPVFPLATRPVGRWKWIEGDKIALPRELQETLFTHFSEQVDEAELPERT